MPRSILTLPLALSLALLSALPSPGRASETATANEDLGFLRGVTVSCPGYGQIWGSSQMARALGELDDLGVRWVSIHPYAGVRRDGSIRYQAAEDTGYLSRAAKLAQDANIELFWKPHLAYWGSFEWRGTIEFGDNAKRWRRFFDDYRAFILDQAQFAESAGVRLFSIGLEYEQTAHFDDEWRRLIREVRQVYSGQITYSANWDRLDQVTFWDQVDYIGVQGYFPLASEDDPSREAILRGWRAPLEQLRRLSERYDKPILFAEIGYDVSPDAAREPWRRNSRDNPRNRQLQRRLMEVALETLEEQPFVAGMFWWKWIPGQRHGGDFSLRPPEVREVLRSAWGPSTAR